MIEVVISMQCQEIMDLLEINRDMVVTTINERHSGLGDPDLTRIAAVHWFSDTQIIFADTIVTNREIDKANNRVYFREVTANVVLGSFYYKVEGKLDQRGIMISMGGYTDGVIESLPRGKEIKIMLLDGVHLSNVIFGMYTFQELLEHCTSHASFRAELYCPHAITR